MFNYQLSFGSPWYLLLLLGLPVLWWCSFNSLAGLGRVRRWVAIGLRTIVLLLLVAAMAEVQMVRVSDRLTVIYLIDQSLSIPTAQRKTMVEYVNAAIVKHRKDEDRVGVVVFGHDAAIEIPPFDDDVQMASEIEVALDREHTNLAGAVKLAQASFPEDAAKRIVVISDGNQNLGNVGEQAQGAAGAGIGIDVLPVRYDTRAEVIVERLAIPSDVRRGQPFDLKVVVSNTAEQSDDDSGEVRGRLVLSQLAGDQSVVLSDQEVALPLGKKVFTIRQEIESSNFYTYEAKFVPRRPEDDAMPQNNRATAFTHVRGKGQVLLIEDFEHAGEFNVLAERLRRQGVEVTVQQSNQLFSSLAELQPYDAVVLANVPRSTSDEVHFTDEQIRMLVRNTQQMGAGLVMLGGPNSFGAGGWTGTELEKAMPVDFQIKSAKVVPRGALAMIMHACEIGQGNHWQKVIAHEAIKVLGERDYCGVLHWNGTDQWLWKGGLTQIQTTGRRRMMAAVDRMTPGDMPQFDPAMRMAERGFAKLQGTAAVKHMIIISDGDPSRPSGAVISALKKMKVTVSTCAVGSHGRAESRLLANIASQTGGKYYAVRNAKALPRIFQREARRVARSLIFDEHPVRPRIRFPHEMISGIEEPLPPIKGFVLTSKKDNPLVEVSLVSPLPVGERNSTVLASWTYGLGKAVVFTSDAGARWTTDWTDQEIYDKLFGQMIRWAMRPTGESGQFTTASDVDDQQVRVVVTALDKDDQFLNFFNMTGTAVGPDLEPVEVKVEQTAPGRYVGTFPSKSAGSYFVMISPGAGMAPIRTGINVPYSDEFRDRTPNSTLLTELSRLIPKGGKQKGLVIEVPEGAQIASEKDRIEALLATNIFRHDLPKATSSRDVWFYVVLVCSCLFFFDVFFRRVQVGFAWAAPLAARVLRRGVKPEQVETIDRLRSRKAEVSDRIEQLRGAARFEPPETPVDVEALEEPPTPGPKPVEPSILAGAETEEESYTERLLRAKRKAWDEQFKGKKDDKEGRREKGEG